jgi:ABC-type multidrug transport system fused ATPase/permease subunit
MRIFFELITVFLICFLVFYLKKNEEQSEIIVILSLFVFSILRLVPVMNRINIAYQNISFNLRSQEILLDEVKNLMAHTDTCRGKSIKNLNKFEARNLSFAYPNSKKNILNNLSFTFYSKQIVGISGISGAGKTTLVNLISGILKPNSGQIFLNSKNINDYDLSSWHKLIGYVSQTSYLSNESVFRNIAFYEEEDDRRINIKYINKLLETLDLNDLIKSLPNGIYSKTGDSGIKVSGGQRQRICIARALYKKPKILILDEPTSSLDSITSRNIIRLLLTLKKKLTIIIISHDLRKIKKVLNFDHEISVKYH